MPESREKAIKVTIQIPESRIKDLLIGAFEGGSNYWYSELLPGGKTKDGDLYARCLRFGFQLVENCDGVAQGVHKVGPDHLVQGLALMAKDHPGHFGAFMSENDDAETADVFLQLVVMGDVTYG